MTDKNEEVFEGYVTKVEKNQTILAEPGDYNLELETENRERFAGTFNNSELEGIEKENAVKDLKEIQNNHLKIKVTYHVTRKRTGYKKITDYEVIS